MKNNKFRVKRLFSGDIPMIEKCYSDFDFLHFNPMAKGKALPMLIQGQIWGIFNGAQIMRCTYMTAGEKDAFVSLNAAWEIADLLNVDMADLLVAGYLWTNENYRHYRLYEARAKLWDIYAAKLGKKQVLHYVPAHIYFDMEQLFRRGFTLKGLRGLDKLVPHYIFTKSTGQNKTEYTMRDVKICPLTDTKEISRLCETGYCGVALDKEGQNIYFIKGS